MSYPSVLSNVSVKTSHAMEVSPVNDAVSFAPDYNDDNLMVRKVDDNYCIPFPDNCHA